MMARQKAKGKRQKYKAKFKILPREQRRNLRVGLTLVELVIVLAISGIISVMTPILMWHGVKALVFLPRALTVNHVATEVAHQIIEGGVSTLTGYPTIRGLRFAARRSSTATAIWYAAANEIGFLNADGQYVVMRFDSGSGTVKRRVMPNDSCPPGAGTEEFLPDQVQYQTYNVTIPAATLFRYYDRSATLVAAPGCGSTAAIRRVQVVLTVQTGSGSFDQGDAQEPFLSSVAIRDP